MFALVEKIDDKHENEMRNFFKPKKHGTEQKWHSILNEDNSKAFESEMTETLIQVNCFITKIEIESSKMDEISVPMRKEDAKKFKEYLALGRELLTNLKTLATLEKASTMEKYEQSHVRKLSYAATEDTVSCVDTESFIDGHGILISRDESFDRPDSRMITLVHKYAASFTKHYEILDKLNHDVEEIIERFISVIDFINQQLQLKLILPINAGQFSPQSEKTAFSIVQTIDEQPEDEIFNDFTASAKSAIDILHEHFQNSLVRVAYKHVSATGAGHLVEHTYGCSVTTLYAEGKSRKKSKAKEEAATEMIKQLIKRQKSNNLPNYCTPFNESQLHELSVKLIEKEDFIDKLEEKCLHSHDPPPLYVIISETGKNNEPYYTVKCEAMGYTVLGHGSEKLHAKKNAAKSILNLVNKN